MLDCGLLQSNLEVPAASLLERATDRTATGFEYVGVDHRRLDAGMAEQFLHGANVVTRLQEMRGKRMPSEWVVRRLPIPEHRTASVKERETALS